VYYARVEQLSFAPPFQGDRFMKAFSGFLTALTVATCSIALFASVNGAIFTTTASGTAVNANIYDSKSDVFLNGGPQNDHGSLLEPSDALY
jgi:hypothetical protein